MRRRSESPAESVVQALSNAEVRGSFVSRSTAGADDLRLHVKGVGRLKLPLTQSQARMLVAVGRPAAYGLGTRTLTDRRVRDCTSVPVNRVTIDHQRFKRSLDHTLSKIREDLGLPEGRTLKAQLQSMLVYGPGQFFKKHRDSEKDDSMLGTLVVTLPSAFKGGEIRIEHGGQRVRVGGSREKLSCVAFYADCEHEVRPVTSGYRVALTYNLMLSGRERARVAANVDREVVSRIASNLRTYFETAVPPSRAWLRDKGEPDRPPVKLVYLLDYQYTERGLSWTHLKGEDAAHALALREGAAASGCEATLALAEIHETWSAHEDGDGDYGWGRRRYFGDFEQDEESDEDEADEDSSGEGYCLDELIDEDITLDRWIDPDTGHVEPIRSEVDRDVTCCTTPTSDLEPERSEYEGYMGNYGNTLDRWYRRAVVLVWPREQAWTIRSEASPGWAMRKAKEVLAPGRTEDAARLVDALLPGWQRNVSHHESSKLLSTALKMGRAVRRPAAAASLMDPFHLETLAPSHATDIVGLVREYGEAWWKARLKAWTDRDRGWARSADSTRFMTALPGLTQRFLEADPEHGATLARSLLENRWNAVHEALTDIARSERPSHRRQSLKEWAQPLRSLLEAIRLANHEQLGERVVELFRDPEREALLPLVVGSIRTARGKWPILAALRDHAVARVQARLSAPPRAEDDWSIAWPNDCRCGLCKELSRFLADRSARTLEWPLAKDSRRHVHDAIDDRELPVTHVTRRTGSPYTLVLKKTDALFEHDADERRFFEKALVDLTSGTEVLTRGRTAGTRIAPGSSRSRARPRRHPAGRTR